jgi:hypothetical protein
LKVPILKVRLLFEGEVFMEQVIFKEGEELLILKGLPAPLSLEEISHYLRAVASQLELKD